METIIMVKYYENFTFYLWKFVSSKANQDWPNLVDGRSWFSNFGSESIWWPLNYHVAFPCYLWKYKFSPLTFLIYEVALSMHMFSLLILKIFIAWTLWCALKYSWWVYEKYILNKTKFALSELQKTYIYYPSCNNR